jgi:hypothetical protein
VGDDEEGIKWAKSLDSRDCGGDMTPVPEL